MSVPDPHYIALYQLQQFIIEDSLGIAAANGTISFFQDKNQNVPKDVFELAGNYSSGYTFNDIGSIVNLGSSGTPVDGSGTDFVIFCLPYAWDPMLPFDPATVDFSTEELYYVVCKGADGTTIFTREAVPANVQSSSGGVASTASAYTNQLLNPTFSEVNFLPATSPGVVTTVANANQVTSIIPDWDIVTSGAGTVTTIQGSQNGLGGALTNPPYYLDITSASISAIELRQRFYQSPFLLWGDTINISFLGLAVGGSVTVTVIYKPSNAGATSFSAPILVATGAFARYDIPFDLVGTENVDIAPGGYVDIIFSFSAGDHLKITSMQLVTVPAGSTAVPAYLEQSVPLQQSLLFSYWQPWLNLKPIPSYLVGWDFPLNPFQQDVSVATSITTTAAYIADQTISQSIGGSYSFTQDSSERLAVTAGSATSAFYLLQYLTAPEALELAQQSALSVNVNAFASTTDVVMRVYMFATTTGTSIPTGSPVGTPPFTLGATGLITSPSAGWVQVTSPNFTIASGNLTTASADYGFSNFNSLAAAAPSTNFAIVVSFYTPTINSVVTVGSISLVPGMIPTRPAPQSASEVLRECQYYLEVNNNWDTKFMSASTSAVNLFASYFTLDYLTIKRVTNPNIVFYSTLGTSLYVTALQTFDGNTASNNNAALGSFWAVDHQSYYGTAYKSVTNSGSPVPLGSSTAGHMNTMSIVYTVTVDARLGVV